MAKTYIEPEDVDKLEEAAGNLRDQLLIRLIFWLGCRVSEALGIRVPEDIDFENSIITIQHLKVRVRRTCPFCGNRLAKTALYCSKCSSKVIVVRETAQERPMMRQIPVDRDTMELVQYYIEQDGTTGRLFKIGRTQAWRIITEAAKKAGLGKLINPATGKVHNVSPHKLRDAFATMAVKTDASMDAVRSLQEQLGHASIATTMKYRKIDGQEQRKWYDKVSRRPGRQLRLQEK